MRRKAAQFAIGSEHAVTRYDQGEWVSAKRLPNGACRTRHAKSIRDLSVRDGCAGWYFARDFVHTLVKRRNICHVELGSLEIRLFALQESRDALGGRLHVIRRRRRLCISQSFEQPRLGLTHRGFRQLNASDTTLAPTDAAAAYGRIE